VNVETAFFLPSQSLVLGHVSLGDAAGSRRESQPFDDADLMQDRVASSGILDPIKSTH
jgi:hypothetical protein